MFFVFWFFVGSAGALTTTRQAPRMEESNPLLKAAWVATEAFGKAFGKEKPFAAAEAPKSRLELVRRIADDYACVPPYFLGGERFDAGVYAEDCEFADPFVSFRGRDRFASNLGNLGSFITDASARALGDPEITHEAYTQKFLVKLRLNLPWQPVLAWPWGVTHVFASSTKDQHLVVRHLEQWDVSPTEGLRQLITHGKGKQVT